MIVAILAVLVLRYTIFGRNLYVLGSGVEVAQTQRYQSAENVLYGLHALRPSLRRGRRDAGGQN